MAKEKVTLTLDSEQLGELRRLIDARSLSSTVDEAVRAYLAHQRHLDAVDRWLDELEERFGPVDADAQTWAAGVMERWDAAARSSEVA